jgi:hypothetical protein
MQRRRLAWVSPWFALLFLFSVLTIADAQEGSIEEAQRFTKEMAQLYGHGRYREAIPLTLPLF